MEAYRDDHPGIRIAYKTDGHLLNSRRMQDRTRLSTTTVHDLLLTDDCALNTTTEVDIQRSMYLLVAGRASFGLAINADKTVVMHQPPPNMQHWTPPRIPADGNQIKTVDNFAYLGGTLSNSTRTDDGVDYRISKARQAFSWLQNSVWNCHGFQLNTKLRKCRSSS
ncbi:hypothetical protein SprV_0301161300 [Sparganum proliferum]